MLETNGVYGGRFSGAEFKRCCMALVNPEFKEKIEYKIRREYIKSFPKLADKFSVHFSTTSDGVNLD